MADQSVAGYVALGIKLDTEPLVNQAAAVEKKVSAVAGKIGAKAGKAMSDESAKAYGKDKSLEKASEKAGEEAGKGAQRGIKRGARHVESESGNAGEKAGKSFISRFQQHAGSANITGAFKDIAGKIARAAMAAFAAKKLFDFGKMAVNLGSDLNEVQNVVDSTFGQGSNAQKTVDSFAKNAATQFGLSETMAKRYAGTLGAMGKAFGFTSDQAADMGTTLAGLSGDVASFYNISQDEAYAKLKGVFTGESEALKDLGVVMTQTALDQYALSHGFGTTTAQMSEQEKVALRYRFVLDKLSTASGDFARTSGGWANQVRLLKLQFESLAATIGQVLIAALTPAIKALNSFMGGLIKAANTFKSFVFSLMGLEASAMGTGSGAALPEALGSIGDGAAGAADGLGDMGDAAKGAGKDASKAANEIKRSLASFDKITKLTDQKSNSGSGSGGSGGSGGGSGSGGSGGAGGGAGSLGDTSSALTNTAWSVDSSGGPLAEMFKKAWENADFTGIGNLIGRKLKKALDDIPWGDIQEGARKIAKSFATFLNGFLETEGLSESVGTTIGEALNTAFIFVNTFVKEFHWDSLGKFISSSIQTAFKTFNWGNLTEFISNILKGALDFGTGLIEGINWRELPKDYAEACRKAFEGFDFKGVFKSVGKLIGVAITAAIDLAAGISELVNDFYGKIKKYFEDHISEAKASGGTVFEGILNGIIEGVANIGSWIYENVVSPFIEGFTEKFDTKTLEDIGGGVIEDFLNGIKEFFKDPIGWVKENIVDPFMEGLKDFDPLAAITGKDKKVEIGFFGKKDKSFTEGKTAYDSVKDGKATKTTEGKKTTLFETVKGIWDKWTDDKATKTADSKKSSDYDTTKGTWDKWTDSTATKTATSKKSTLFGTIKSIWDKWTSNTAKKTVTGGYSSSKSFLKVRSAYNGVHNSWARKTVTGEKKKSFISAKTSYDQVKDKSKKVTVTGKKSDSFVRSKTSYDQVKDKSRTVTFGGHVAGSFTSGKSTYDKPKDNSVEKSFKGKLSSSFTDAKKKYDKPKDGSVTKTFKAILSGAWDTVKKFFKRKKGGVYANGHWSPIQRYAEGGSPDGGQLFVAREAGPELVGTLGGHTAVMNNDQIVASVSSGVAKAISGIKFYARGNGGLSVMDAYLPRLADVGNGIRSDTSQLIAYAKQAEAAQGAGNNAEVIELLRRILEILTLIDPDVYIDGEKVTSKIVSIINAQTRATGRPAIIV